MNDVVAVFNNLWSLIRRGFAPLKAYFNEAFIRAFVKSPNFIVFVIAVFVFVIGFKVNGDTKRWLCKFWGILIAVFSVLEFVGGYV